MSWWVWMAVALVGGVGALGRFVLDKLITGRAVREFPLGTLAINLSGALVLGLIVGLSVRGNLLAIVGTALIGSYTTFSTWMLETHRLAEEAEGGRAVINALGSLLVGFGFALLGHAIGASL